MNNPLVSIIMPAYNVENYISNSILSVISQTYSNWELIVVDDGSEDKTAEIIKKYQLLDHRIIYIFQKNSRQSQARNTAISYSSGKYIAFLDADDLWMPEKLSVSIDLLIKDECDLIFTDCYIFEDNLEGKTSSYTTAGVERQTYSGEQGILKFLDKNRIPNLTVVVKRNTLVSAGQFIDILVAEEYEMWIRLLKNGAVFKSIPLPLSLYRIRNNSLTANDRVAILETMVIIKNFAKINPNYKDIVSANLVVKLKSWIYTGHKVSNSNFRKIALGIRPISKAILLYILSYFLPFIYFRKILNRML